MSNNKQNTKQKILDISINLFAKDGYKEVSMRQIASNVGIKASSLYKHYKSKEDILEQIYALFRVKLRQSEEDMPIFKSAREYFEVAYQMFKQVMWEEKVLKIAKIITNERTHSDKAREFLKHEMTVRTVESTKYVLDYMKENKFIRDVDTQVVAEEYCGYIVYLYFEQNILSTHLDLDLIDQKMKQHNEFMIDYLEGK